MKLVVGLGNIGKQFEGTNHNMGFMTLDIVAQKIGANFNKKQCSSIVAELNYNGEKVVLAKPTTFMNNSGIAVKSLVKKYNVDIGKDLIIISDDIDLPRSKVRVRREGSAGTHNGLKSIVSSLQTTSFNRLRIGIDPPKFGDLADYVLSDCKMDSSLEEGLNRGAQAIMMFIEGQSIDNIMQAVN